MFGLFKKKSEKDILLKKYKLLTEEAYKLSHINRMASDEKTKEIDDLSDYLNKMDPEELAELYKKLDSNEMSFDDLKVASKKADGVLSDVKIGSIEFQEKISDFLKDIGKKLNSEEQFIFDLYVKKQRSLGKTEDEIFSSIKALSKKGCK